MSEPSAVLTVRELATELRAQRDSIIPRLPLRSEPVTTRQLPGRIGCSEREAYIIMREIGQRTGDGYVVDADTLDNWIYRHIDCKPFLRNNVNLNPPRTAGVYCVQGLGEYVKIGRANNIAKRVRDIQTNHPVLVRLLAILSTNQADEKKFHVQFRASHVQGEWFHYSEEIKAYLQETGL